MSSAENLMKLDKFYEWNGDTMRCRACFRMQQISWQAHDFQHRAGCKHEDSPPRPWDQMRLILLDAEVSYPRRIDAVS